MNKLIPPVVATEPGKTFNIERLFHGVAGLGPRTTILIGPIGICASAVWNASLDGILLLLLMFLGHKLHRLTESELVIRGVDAG